ncbi:MAG TPA: L-aspartate oxidase [Armatimonadota bacterium]|jgi:L-aspartate oxidase
MSPSPDHNQPETRQCRFLVIGSGIAGLWTALHLAPHGDVTLLTKSRLRESNTQYAQGGIAVALPSADSPELHREDTLEAGAGLCDEPAVSVLTREGPNVVRELIAEGADFDRLDGELLYGREAAHGMRRILHAHGDATGAEVQRTATEAISHFPQITVHEETAAVELLRVDGQCLGVEAVDLAHQKRQRFLADCTVLATGGAGGVYRYTTNPPVATADGPALAWRAGAYLRDMEFVQFHPTALWASGYPKFLISEAVRGEGARLVDAQGQRFMPAYHELAELAPRDIVARAIFAEMEKAGADCMYLDFSPLGEDRLRQRFPGIVEELLHRGFDPFHHPIPICPAAHYMMGGVLADLHGFTGVPRLFACGECADYGVHGANRLASNSLLDGLVFGVRTAAAMAQIEPLPEDLRQRGQALPTAPAQALPEEAKTTIQRLAWAKIGIVRTKSELTEAVEQLGALGAETRPQELATVGELEAANMCQVAWLVATAALIREESRGAHYRSDFPDTEEAWRRHILLRQVAGVPEITYRPVILEHE